MGYREAPRLDLVEDLAGHRVADPYRWLEDDDGPAVARWLTDQAALYAEQLPCWHSRDLLRRRLEAMTPGVVGLPRMRGDRAFFPRRLPGQDQASWIMTGPDGAERIILDPARLSDDGTVVLQWALPSPEGRHLAYAVDEGGREEVVVRIVEVDSGAEVGPPLCLGRGGQLAWVGDEEGIVVVATLPDLPADEAAFHRRVWRLPLGAGRDEAELLFGAGRDRTTYYGIDVSADGRWLTVSAALGTAPRNDLYLGDLAAPTLDFVPVLEGVDGQAGGTVAADGCLWLWTNVDAPRGRLVRAQVAAPSVWDVVVPERIDVLVDWELTDHALVAAWRRDVASAVTVHDRATGAQIGEVALPGFGSVMLAARPGGVGDDLWLSYTDELTPAHVLQYDLATWVVAADDDQLTAAPPVRPDGPAPVCTEGAGDDAQGVTRPIEGHDARPRHGHLWAAAPGALPPTDGLEVVRAFVTSPDGTSVPLFVARRRDQPLDGTAPTILYGYGGFQVSLTPAYNSGARAWVEGGGVYATACLRGGGEYGEAWHRDGMRGVKQHVFDDFLACADWLVDSGHTSPAHLAIAGGSNGGLLVGAALTQAPERFRAVHCSAPLLDMVRYERFGLGITWNDEYGTAGVPEELGWLLAYSPYHRVVDATPYPAVLFTTFGGDTRVHPLHARKMCAALQHATTGLPAERPVLLRHEEAVGHGMRTVSRSLDERSEVLAFLAAQVGWPAQDGEPLGPSCGPT